MPGEENESNELVAFSQAQVRRVWHNGEWYYSIVDIIAVLTDSTSPRDYWSKLKNRAKTEGFEETLAQVIQLRLKAPDGRLRLTDTATRQTLLRLIQSIPSPKAEPVRLWLAQVGEERIEEIEHPEAALERVRERLRAQGYDNQWIEERIKNDLIRNELTDEWKERGAQEGIEFAILTDTLSKGTFGLSIQAHRRYKLLPAKINLRDHMTPLELALCSLSEATAITLHQNRDSQGFPELKRDTVDAGQVGQVAREAAEKAIGEPAVSPKNYLDLTRKVKGKPKKGQAQLPERTTPTLFDEPADPSESDSP